MTNSDNGGALANQILLAVAQQYGWPVPAPEERIPVALPVAALEAWAGRYELRDGGGATIEIRIERDTLRGHLPDGETVTLLPESDSTFFDRNEGVRVLFRTVGDTTFLRAAGSTATRPARR
jgi:hypothetical protein